MARKSRLAQEKTKAFLGIYEPYVKEHTVKLKASGMWLISGGEGCTADNFPAVRIFQQIVFTQIPI